MYTDIGLQSAIFKSYNSTLLKTLSGNYISIGASEALRTRTCANQNPSFISVVLQKAYFLAYNPNTMYIPYMEVFGMLKGA